MSTPPIDKGVLKARVLAGETYYAIGKELGVNPLELSSALKRDPDIAAARREGLIRTRAPRQAPDHYASLPYVQDVLLHGMTASAAASKHGVSQPWVSRCVARAKVAAAAPDNVDGYALGTSSGIGGDGARAADREADNIVGAILLLAARRGISPQAALQTVAGRLPGTA